jgi:hypothetical protein
MARENVFHNHILYRHYKRRSAMESKPNQENGELDQNINVHEICEEAFVRARIEEQRTGLLFNDIYRDPNNEYVTVHDIRERFNVLLCRPKAHVKLKKKDPVFWLTIIDVHEGPRHDSIDLVALKSDSEQFYMQYKDSDTPEPYGVNESRVLSKIVTTGYLMPEKITN